MMLMLACAHKTMVCPHPPKVIILDARCMWSHGHKQLHTDTNMIEHTVKLIQQQRDAAAAGE